MDEGLIPDSLLGIVSRPTFLLLRWLDAQEDATIEAPTREELAAAFTAAYEAIADILEPLEPDAVRVHAEADLWRSVHTYLRRDECALSVGVWTRANVRLGNARTRVIGELGRLRVWRTPDGAVETLPIVVETVPDYPPADL